MSENSAESNLCGTLEALLFVTDEPVGVLKLAEACGRSAAEVQDALEGLSARFELEGRGIQLREVAGGWRFFTHPAYHEVVERYVLSWDTRKLSAAAMETLAIVAYAQPITRAQLAALRGVSSDSPLSSLVDKGFVAEVGMSDAPGNPTLYGTTKLFLEKFGLRNLADLPNINDFAPDDETRKMIADRLSSVRSDAQMSEEGALLAAQEYMEENGATFVTGLYGEEAFGAGDEFEASGRPHGGGVQAGGEGALGEVPSPFGAESAQAGAGAGALGAHAASSLGGEEARQAMTRAVASALGVVDKINFDELSFDFDEE